MPKSKQKIKFTKKDFVDVFAEKYKDVSISKKNITETVNAFFDTIVECMQKCDQLVFTNYFTFKKIETKARKYQTLQGKVIDCPSKKRISVKVSRSVQIQAQQSIESE